MFQSQSLLASDSNSDPNSYSNSSDLEGSSSSSDGGNISRYKNDFLEIAELGRGGYGKVFRCLNKLDGKEYAVKMVPFARKMTERVLWEVKTIAKMSHPNVARYYQAWIEKGVIGSPVISTDSDTFSQDDSISQKDRVLYIVLELCDGILEQKPPLPQDSLGIFLKICDGVEHIHQKSIVHRDLSTKNIFLDDQVPKIGDFGLARFLPDEGKVYLSNNSGRGAIKYIAPETVKNDPCYASRQSDIYSLGVLLFELLYPMATTSEEADVLGDLKYKKLFPQGWKYKSYNKMILNMIEEDPNSRPNVATVKSYLLKALEKFYNKMPVIDAADQTDKEPGDIQYDADYEDRADEDPRDIQYDVDSADRTGKESVNSVDQTGKDPRNIKSC